MDERAFLSALVMRFSGDHGKNRVQTGCAPGLFALLIAHGLLARLLAFGRRALLLASVLDFALWLCIVCPRIIGSHTRGSDSVHALHVVLENQLLASAAR